MAEHLTVAQVVVGSSPIIRPNSLPCGGCFFHAVVPSRDDMGSRPLVRPHLTVQERSFGTVFDSQTEREVSKCEVHGEVFYQSLR